MFTFMVDKKKGYSVPLSAFFLLFAVAGIIGCQVETSEGESGPTSSTETTSNLELGKALAKDMATGEIILMASCLAKEGKIPRDKMGDFVAAGVAKQGITKAELYDNWDSKYWPLAKEAEKRNRTSCLN
jgi:hypothetical protein